MSAFEADRFNHSRTSPEAVVGSRSWVVGFSPLVLANDQRSRTTGHSLSPASKESLQHFGASPGQNAGANLHAMIQAGVIQYLHHRADSARFGVISAVNQAL